jgi:hypothetical protein
MSMGIISLLLGLAIGGLAEGTERAVLAANYFAPLSPRNSPEDPVS